MVQVRIYIRLSMVLAGMCMGLSMVLAGMCIWLSMVLTKRSWSCLWSWLGGCGAVYGPGWEVYGAVYGPG